MKRARKLIKSERGIFEPAMSEDDVLGQIRAMLEANGAKVKRHIERIPYCPRCHKPIGRPSEGGIPDLSGYFTINSRITWVKLNREFPVPFWWEVKKPGGKWSSLFQQTEVEQMQKDGLISYKVESWNQVMERLKEHGIEVTVK